MTESVKKLVLFIVLLFLGAAPVLIVLPVRNYFRWYDQLVTKYECYPVNSGVADFDGDGVMDSIEVAAYRDDPNGPRQRLIFLLNGAGERKEVLNVAYDSTDYTFRTHLAIVWESGLPTVVIYDTVNPVSYFVWTGGRFEPAETIGWLPREVRTAMEMTDDTGGRSLRRLLTILAAVMLGLYYIMFLITVGVLVRPGRRKRAIFS